MVKLSTAKEKGRAWETACVLFAQEHGYPLAERRRLSGVEDRGDIAGIPLVVVECKNERTYQPLQWRREADQEAENDRAILGVVWFKKNGLTGAENGEIMMRPDQFFWLLQRAGFVGAQAPEMGEGDD